MGLAGTDFEISSTHIGKQVIVSQKSAGEPFLSPAHRYYTSDTLSPFLEGFI